MKYAYLLMILAVSAILVSGCVGASDESSGSGFGRPEKVEIGVSPQGLVVFSGAGTGDRDLYLLNMVSNRVSRLTKSTNYEATPAFSPDGKSVVYVAASTPTDATHIYVMSASGGTPIQLTSDPKAADCYPRFSSDGSKIVFSRAHRMRPYSMGGYIWDNWDIYVIDSNGKNPRRITNKSYQVVYSPVFCNKDKSIVYSIDQNNSNSIMSVDITKASPAPKTITSGWGPDCLMNSGLLTFIDDKRTKYDYEVWTSSIDGKQRKQVTNLRSYTEYPLFIDKGQQIIFLLNPSVSGYPELWKVGRNGQNAKKVAGGNLFADPMNWKP